MQDGGSDLRAVRAHVGVQMVFDGFHKDVEVLVHEAAGVAYSVEALAEPGRRG